MIEYINKNWLHWIKLLNYIYWKKNEKYFKTAFDTFALDVWQQENRIRQDLIAKLDNGMKWYIVVVAQFKKMVTTDQGTLEERMQSNHLSTPTFKAFNQLDIDADLPTAYQNLFTKFDEQERQGSGWYLSKLIQIEVHTATLSPLEASSYIELPKRTQAVLNIKNEDNMSFIWSVLAHLHPMDNTLLHLYIYNCILCLWLLANT